MPVKVAIAGPFAAAGGGRGRRGSSPPCAPGCGPWPTPAARVVEVHEPAPSLPGDDAGRGAFAAAHRAAARRPPRAAPRLARDHRRRRGRAGPGGALRGAVPEPSLRPRSTARRAGVSSPWRRRGGGSWSGVGDASGRRRTRLEDVVWAAGYAASTRGRGMDRVGIAPSGSLAGLAPARARAVIDLLGEAARTIAGGRDEVLERLDPRAIDARSPRRWGCIVARGSAGPADPASGRQGPRATPHVAGMPEEPIAASTRKEPLAAMPTRYWHPFADMHRVQDHELVLVRGDGSLDRGRRRAALPRRDGGPLVLQRRPRPDRDRRRRRAAALDAGRVLELRRLRDRADPRAGRSPGCAGADGGRVGLLRLRRLRRRRHRGQARPALLGRAGAPGEADRRQPRARLPRHARLRDGAVRDPGDAGRLRRPDRRRHDPGLGPRRRGAGAALPGAREGDRRLHRRAGHRRRRGDPAGGRLLGGRHPPLRRPRRPARRRRGHHGVRAPRDDVRQRALRDRAGHDHASPRA